MSPLPRQPSRDARDLHRAAFTMIEVMAAILLTSIVITAAVAFYVNLSDASNRATVTMRRKLHAHTLLERLGGEIQNAAMLVKPEALDPLRHPWFFVAESQHSFDGSDRIKFISRSHSPRVTAYHSSDLAHIVYFTVAEEDETYTLYRWLSPTLPLEYDPSYPSPDDDRSLVVTEGLRDFSLRFLGPDGEWVEEWDSTQLVHSSELPRAVEIRVRMYDEAMASDDELDLEEDDTGFFTRVVTLPTPPIDLEAMIEAKLAAEAEALAQGSGLVGPDGEPIGGDAATYQQCLDAAKQDCCPSASDPAACMGLQLGDVTSPQAALILGERALLCAQQAAAGCRQ